VLDEDEGDFEGILDPESYYFLEILMVTLLEVEIEIKDSV